MVEQIQGLSRRATLSLAAGAALIRPARAAESVVLRRQYVDGPFGQMHVRMAMPASQGAAVKPPLACFHFTPGSSRMYEAIMPLLATDRLVMAFDTPGYGASTPPPHVPNMGDYVNAMAAALGALGYRTDGAPIDVMGHLTGSLIATEMSVRNPKWIRRVVLSRTPAFSAERRKSYVAEMVALAEGRKKDIKGQYLIDRLNRGLGQLRPGEGPELYMGAFIDSVTPGHRWVDGEVAAISYPGEDRLPLVTQPVLLFTYPDVTTDEWLRTPTLLKTASVVHLAEAGPWLWQQQADLIARHVRPFLDLA